MAPFVLQYKDIDVILIPEFNDENLNWKIQYDESELEQLKINKENFETEIKLLLGQ